MQQKDLIKLLKNLDQQIPEPTRKDFLRERLMSQIKFYQFSEPRRSLAYLGFKEFISNLFFPWRLAHSLGTVSLVLIFFIIIGIGTTVGSNFTDPGEAFYSVKVTLERMPLVLPASPEVKIKKEIELAQNRRQEMDDIISSSASNQEKSKQIKAVAKHLSHNIETTQKRVEEISQQQEESKVVVAVASSFKASISGIKESLNQASKAMEELDINGEISQELRKVQDQAAEAELSALGVMIAVVGADSQGQADDDGLEPDLSVDINDIDSQVLSEEQDILIIEDDFQSSSATLVAPDLSEDIILDEDIVDPVIKDQVVKELWTAIDEMEAVLEGQVVESEEDTVEESNSSEVILNVEDIINQGLKEQDIREVIEKAKLALQVDKLAVALEYIEQARSLLKEL